MGSQEMSPSPLSVTMLAHTRNLPYPKNLNVYEDVARSPIWGRNVFKGGNFRAAVYRKTIRFADGPALLALVDRAIESSRTCRPS